MPRRARITLPGVAHHLIQRGNNRQACFYANQDYQLFLEWLQEYAPKSNCRIRLSASAC
jgi:putative transposase